MLKLGGSKKKAGDQKDAPSFSSAEELEDYVDERVRQRLDEILARAKERSDEIEEEWRDPDAPNIDEVEYYVEGEKIEKPEPESIERRKEPRPYMSYAEVVLDEVKKARRDKKKQFL